MGSNELSNEHGFVHDTAIIDPGVRSGPAVEVGAYSHVHSDVQLGPGSRLSERVIVGPRVVLGRSVTLSPGVVLEADAVLGDDVEVGANSVVLTRSGSGPEQVSTSTTIGNGVSLGANVTVLAGVTIAGNAVVGAGSVVTRDVPPNATVVGSPARIVGYRSTSPNLPAQRIRASSFDHAAGPLRVGRATLHRHPRVDDLRGSLTFGQTPDQVPFTVRRYFLVFDVPSREVRGEHAHRALHQMLVCVRGECAVAIDDGSEQAEVVLDEPTAALHLPPMVWGTQYKYSADAALLVFASAEYDDADYIRDYDEFCQELSAWTQEQP